MESLATTAQVINSEPFTLSGFNALMRIEVLIFGWHSKLMFCLLLDDSKSVGVHPLPTFGDTGFALSMNCREITISHGSLISFRQLLKILVIGSRLWGQENEVFDEVVSVTSHWPGFTLIGW